MEYFLRHIEPGVSSPFTLDLPLLSYVFGSHKLCMGYEKLQKYSQVTEQHACFVRKEEDWYVADMGSPGGTYINYRRLDSYCLKKLEVGDHIGFGAKEVTDGFVCALCVKCPPQSELKIKSEPTDSCTDCAKIETCNVFDKQNTQCLSQKDISFTEQVSKKRKTDFVEVSVQTCDEDVSRSKSVPEHLQTDVDRYDQILRNLSFVKPVITHSSQKEYDYSIKQAIELSAKCFENPSKPKKDASGKVPLETQEVRHGIEKIRKRLHSKGKITFNPNSLF